jgi:hypothetical protein
MFVNPFFSVGYPGFILAIQDLYFVHVLIEYIIRGPHLSECYLGSSLPKVGCEVEHHVFVDGSRLV